MAYVFLICVFLAFLLGNALYKKYCNPVTIYLSIFSLALFMLFSTDYINIGLITSKVWTMYVVSIAAFMLGVLLQRVIRIGFGSGELVTDDTEYEKQVYRREIRGVFLLSLVSTLIYWANRIGTYGFLGFLQDLLLTKETENLRGLPVLVLYVKMLTVFLSPFVVNYIVEYREYQLKYFLIVVFTMAANLGYSRNVVFYIAVLDLFVLLYARQGSAKKITLRWLLYPAASIAAVQFFSYTQSLLNKQFSISGTFLGRQLSIPMITIISYFAGPLVSTGVYMDRTFNLPILGYTFRSLLNLLNMFGIYRINTTAYMPTEFVKIPFRFNTTTLQLYIFKEGGWFWIVVFFLLLGYFSDYIYWGYARTRSRYKLMVLALVSLLLVSAIRSYIFTRLDFFIYIVTLVVIVVSRKFKIKR